MEKDILNYSPTVMFRGTPCMVLATDIQYIGYKGLRQVYLYSVQIYEGLFTNIADILVES